jgi:hypothetical protein
MAIPCPLRFLNRIISDPFLRVRRISGIPAFEHLQHSFEIQPILDMHVKKAARDFALHRIPRFHDGVLPSGPPVSTL